MTHRHPRVSTRALDEIQLEWLRLADAGVPRAQIAALYGRSKNTIVNFIAAVRRDLAASEEQ